MEVKRARVGQLTHAKCHAPERCRSRPSDFLRMPRKPLTIHCFNEYENSLKTVSSCPSCHKRRWHLHMPVRWP